ncbi:MAG: tail fiber domain-containing protein [Crocinitomicaceae bacterium]|nr:tail fiber domain-containing protein [Crocinitomicaceae bacterium]
MKISNLLSAFILTFVSFSSFSQLQVRNDEFIQIGYDDYRTLTFGIESNVPNNGRYALEHWNNGLNFWKPWPTSNTANFILFLRDDNHIGMGTQGSSSYRLDIAGSARSWGWYTTSDERLKEKVAPIKNSLALIQKLNGVSYYYRATQDKYAGVNKNDISEIKAKTIAADKDGVEVGEAHIGFLAQEVQEVIPSAVKKQEDGLLSINYNELIPILVEAIKEQQQEIEELKKQIKGK